MLGRGTCFDVVENPSLLDKIDYLNKIEKKQVRKILSSKHLYYEERCSYHNGNRLHLPHDLALQRSLHLITLRYHDDENEEDLLSHHGALCGPLNRLRRTQSHEDSLHKGYVPHLALSQANVNRRMSLESGRAVRLQKEWTECKSLVLEEQKARIEDELMELERQRVKWEMSSKKRDQKLEKMRMENEKMTLELKRVELGAKV